MLLEAASTLRKTIDKVRAGNGDVKEVEVALKEVKSKKKEFQDIIVNRLTDELSALEEELATLDDRSEGIVEVVTRASNEREQLLTAEVEGDEMKKTGDEMKVKRRLAKIQEAMGNIMKEYDGILERIDATEHEIALKEFMALSVGVRELSFIERECTIFVENFTREMRRKSIGSASQSSVNKLSRSEIQKELQSAQRQFWEQMILPNVVENEDIGNSHDQDSMDFTQRLKQALEDSREMQKNLEASIRKKLKRLGDEKRVIVNCPMDEIVKGFPEVEVKWMFGGKEVVVPNAVKTHLFHGWRKWREEIKGDLKRNLLENVELGKKYVTERQERILLDRDKVASSTWFYEERNRWEMDPIAVPYALSRKLIENARIRHDWGAMYLALKGDDKEYYVNLKEFEMLFEDFGGFDGLYLKMLASGIPMSVQLMWIPISELDFHQQNLLLKSLSQQCLIGLWNSATASSTRELFSQLIQNTIDDILAIIIIPVIDFVTSCLERRPWGMAWLNYADQSFNWTVWYSKWQYDMEMSFNSRNVVNVFWYLWFVIRIVVCGQVVFHVIPFLKRKIPRVLGIAYERDPNLRKLQKVKAYFEYRKLRFKRRKRGRKDPISYAFDRMKRVKNPPIRLKDFASIEFMREEVNEVVAFLQNPHAFQEMGARAPRGVLIVGESGTGKTSLALAIAAEANVPVVEVKAEQLEGGFSMVGQGASNVRELFQTARDLAPVIIFVEDFDIFAGVRGTSVDTQNQDHEAFINQLLVELDGFEKQEGVVLMATTQNLKNIDEALIRPGRMDRIFHLQPPTQAERVKILRFAAKDNMDAEVIDFLDWEKVAEKTSSMHPVELKSVPLALEGSAFKSKFLDTEELKSYCSWFATFRSIVPTWVKKTTLSKTISKMLVNHLGLKLTKEDVQDVVDLMEPYGVISNGIELVNPPGVWTRDTKLPHAVWAAGRGLIAALLPNFDVVHNLWLEPSSWEGVGCTKITKGERGGFMDGSAESRSYLEKKLVSCFGSYIAAQLLLPFGEENLLSFSELKQAEEIATRMVIQYGWGPNDNPTIYHNNNSGGTLSMGENHFFEMASNVEKMYNLGYDKAKAILQGNCSVLEKIVDELVEFEVLTGKDLERIISENGGTREVEPFFLSRCHDKEPVLGSLLENGNPSRIALLS